MAKALLGHVGLSTDMRLAQEVRRLQLRVKELEAEIAECRTEQALDAAVSTLEQREPAYT